jgi:hypothetical protein
MAISESDLNLINYVGTSPEALVKMSAKERKDALAEALKKLTKALDAQGNPENLENAKNFAPKVKELLQNPPKIQIRKVTKGDEKTSVTYPECLIIGYSAAEKMYLTITANPKKDTKKPNIVKVSESDIIFKAEDMKD